MIMLLMLLSQMAVVTDTAGLRLYVDIPIRSKGIAQYEMVLDSFVDIVPCGDTIQLLERATGFNGLEFGRISFKRTVYFSDTLVPIEQTVDGWIIIRYKKAWFVKLEEEKRSGGLDLNLFCYGQSLDISTTINTETDLRWFGVCFVGVIILELILFCIFGKTIRKLFKSPTLVLFGVWLLTAVGFGLTKMNDIMFIFKGGLQ